MEHFKTTIANRVIYVSVGPNYEVQVTDNSIYKMSGVSRKIGYTKVTEKEFKNKYEKVVKQFNQITNA